MDGGARRGEVDPIRGVQVGLAVLLAPLRPQEGEEDWLVHITFVILAGK